MIALYSISIIIAVLAVGVSIGGTLWMRVTTSIVLFLFAVYIIAFGFGNAARSVAADEIVKETVSTQYLAGIGALRREMGPYEVVLFIVCCGFLALGVSRRR